MHMELYQLRYFVAVAETGSFTRAAERCHVTQPALSGAIAKLEDDLGAKLFLRNNRVVMLTGAGQRLLEDSIPILKACNEVRANIRGEDVAKVLRLGIVRTLPTHKLTSLLTALRADLTNLEIEIVEGAASELDEYLAMDKLDVALTILPESSIDSTNEMPIFQERYMLYAYSSHPLASKKEVALADLNDQYFIFRTSCEICDATLALLREKSVHPKVACRTEQDDRALELVRAGFAVTLMPAIFEASGVKKIAISDYNVSRTVGLKWAAGRNNKLIERFCVFARTHPW